MSVPVAIRARVRERARQRCEYCHKPEAVTSYPFHIEHIIARKHGGTSDPENLAWACFQCNIAKGTDVASYDTQTGELVPFFNPRQQDWQTHFALDESGVVTGLTPIGRVTVRMLQINTPEQVEVRYQLIESKLW